MDYIGSDWANQKWAELPNLKVGMNKSGQKHCVIFQILRMYIMLCQPFYFISFVIFQILRMCIILCQPFFFISLSFFYRSVCILQVIIGRVIFRQGIILI